MFIEITPATLATKLATAINISFHDVTNVVDEINALQFENDTDGSKRQTFIYDCLKVLPQLLTAIKSKKFQSALCIIQFIKKSYSRTTNFFG